MKKIIAKAVAVIMVVAVVFSLTCSVLAQNDVSAPPAERLRFNSNGSFRILHLTDTQDDWDARPGMIQFIETALEKYKPDLVVFTGDNVSSLSTEIEAKLAIEKIIDPIEAAGVPFTFVFGNHDAEDVSKEYQFEVYTQYNTCLAYDFNPELYGMGNHSLPIYSSDGSKIAYNLWMFDSNMYNEEKGGYDHIHEDQLQWYVDFSNMLKEQNGGEPVPSMAFQHIVPNEVYDYILESDTQVEGSYASDGKWRYLNPDYAVKGSIIQENPCPGTVDSQQMELFAQQGDVVGVFFGHDHVNDYVINTALTNAKGDGIDLVNTPGITFQSYGNENVRGCRIIDLNEKDPWTYKTETPTFFDVMGNTEEMHKLSYFSENIAWWYIAEFLGIIPGIGTALSEGLLTLVYGFATV